MSGTEEPKLDEAASRAHLAQINLLERQLIWARQRFEKAIIARDAARERLDETLQQLAKREAEVKAQAWDEGGQDPYGFDPANNPYRGADQ